MLSALFGQVIGFFTGQVRDRVLIPLTNSFIRWRVRRLSKSADETLVPERTWIQASAIIYASIGLPFGCIAASLSEHLFWGIVIYIVCVVAGTIYGHFIYKEAITQKRGDAIRQSP